MKAIIVINNSQFRVAEGERFLIEMPNADKFVAETTSFNPDKILLVENEDGTLQFEVKPSFVELEVVRRVRSDKIRTMKYRRRKRYNVFMTSRREFVEISVKALSNSSKK